MTIQTKLNILRQCESFERVYLESDLDPGDDKTPGWTAGILWNENNGGTFYAVWQPTVNEAVSMLYDDFINDRVD